MSIQCLVLSAVAMLFKFNLTALLAPNGFENKKTFFNIYFFSKMIFVICLTVLNFYLIFVFILRIDIEYIELPDQEKAFSEGRLELSTKQKVTGTLSINLILIMICQLHTLQNFYWLKLKSLSWEDTMNKANHEMEDDGDDSIE
jgi:hypothetical protein